jgi:cytochrome c5
MIKTLLIVWMSVGLIACGEKTEDTATDVADTDEAVETGDPDLANGETVHDSICMGCHSGNPAMADNASSFSDDELAEIIQNGSGSMPGQGLSDTDLRDVIAFLRETYGG